MGHWFSVSEEQCACVCVSIYTVYGEECCSMFLLQRPLRHSPFQHTIQHVLSAHLQHANIMSDMHCWLQRGCMNTVNINVSLCLFLKMVFSLCHTRTHTHTHIHTHTHACTHRRIWSPVLGYTSGPFKAHHRWQDTPRGKLHTHTHTRHMAHSKALTLSCSDVSEIHKEPIRCEAAACVQRLCSSNAGWDFIFTETDKDQSCHRSIPTHFSITSFSYRISFIFMGSVSFTQHSTEADQHLKWN